ncbi:MAG TPA: hypothetical protein VH638_09940 [Gemmatimonadaceae bacterium]|jgi:hypothetical protein
MRTTIVLVAVAVLAVAILAGCRARDEPESDSATSDTPRTDDTVVLGGTLPTDSGQVAARPPRSDTARPTRTIRRVGDSSSDSTLPPDDSIRAMRPAMPQVTPEKRPRTWRGFKLPEEMPVRAPVETIKRVEQVPDSVMKGDSTKPPLPDR